MNFKTKTTVSLTVLAIVTAFALTGCGQAAVETDAQANAVTSSSNSQGISAETAKGLQATFPTPLGEEDTDVIETLPFPYPDSYALLHDANFFSLIDGRVVLVDTAAETNEVKGSIHSGALGSVAASPQRGEIYISTTYYSRGIDGDRTDVVSIFDMKTFTKSGEIIIPPKRYNSSPFKGKMRVSGDHSQAYVYNFTPAASITVIDLESKTVLSEVPIPGCALAYPMGSTGFASMCGDGTVMGVVLDAAGNVVSENRSSAFVDIDNDAAFMKNMHIGETLHIPTFTGNIHVVDLSTGTPSLKSTWSLVSDAERKSNWRPGGWQIVANDNDGHGYVIMNPDGKEGSHKDPGTEVWVYDLETKKRVNKFKMQTPAFSISIIGERLVVTTAEMQIDYYDKASGDYLRGLGGAAQTPFIVYNNGGN